MIVEPPSEVGVDHETVTFALPATAFTFNGADGTVIGVAGLLGADGGPVSTPLSAVTVNV